LAEVLVLGQEYPLFPSCSVDDVLIGKSWRYLSNGENVMTLGAKCADDCKVAALVRDEFHSKLRARRFEDFLVSHRIGGVR
jgi:hypothetical protein